MNSSNILPSVANVASPQNQAEASSFAKETVGDFQEEFQQRDFSLRLLGLLAGIALIVMSVFGFFGDFLTLHWIDASFHLYVFALGLLMVVLESEGRLSVLSGLENSVHDSVPFLK